MSKQPLVSVTLTVIGNVPSWLVVPASSPVEALRVMPVGSVPESMVQFAVPRMPVAVKKALNAVPACTLVAAGLVMVMVWQPMIRV